MASDLVHHRVSAEGSSHFSNPDVSSGLSSEKRKFLSIRWTLMFQGLGLINSLGPWWLLNNWHYFSFQIHFSYCQGKKSLHNSPRANSGDKIRDVISWKLRYTKNAPHEQDSCKSETLKAENSISGYLHLMSCLPGFRRVSIHAKARKTALQVTSHLLGYQNKGQIHILLRKF